MTIVQQPSCNATQSVSAFTQQWNLIPFNLNCLLNAPGTYTLRLTATDAPDSQNTGFFLKGADTSFTANAGGLDLSVSKTASPTVLVRGQNVVYSITVSNIGNVAAATNTVSLTDVLPSGLTHLAASYSGTGWTCSGTQTVNCTYAPGIAAGANSSVLSIEANVTGPVASQVTNLVTVYGDNAYGTNTFSLVSDVASLPPVPVPSSVWLTLIGLGFVGVLFAIRTRTA